MEYTLPRVNSKVNLVLWVTMCQYDITCNKFTSLVGDEDNCGVYTCVETGNIWQIAVPSSQVHYQVKTVLKPSLKKQFKK
jgi:hypothetical protein